ncbi:MAG: PAS domain S-box protein [Cyanobacteriota bacterium]|nr:PAS domain S-box protein [Cyanobacteriota bacterium]
MGVRSFSQEIDKISRRVSQKLSLQVVLLVPFFLLITGTVGLVGYLSFRNGQATVRNLASQLRSELTERIHQELHEYFSSPHDINQLNATALVQDKLDVVSGEGENFLWRQMKIAPNLAFVYCSRPDNGEFFGVLRDPKNKSLQLSYSNESTDFYRVYYALDVRGNRTYKLRTSDKQFDSRLRPWYSAALLAGGATWSDIYISFTTKLPNITASLPIYNKMGNRLVGVCATDVVLPEEFRDFLASLEIGKSGQAFVIDRSGILVSSSSEEPLFRQQDNKIKLIKATESRSYLTRKTANFLENNFESLKQIRQPQQLEYILNGQRQFIQVSIFKDGYGLDWLTVLVVPESDFMEQISINNRITFALCIIALFLATIIGLFISRQLAKSIQQLSQVSEEIAAGNLSQYVEVKHTKELTKLAKSFNSMAAQLRETFQSLEDKNAQLEAVLNAVPGSISWMNSEGRYLGSNSYLTQSQSTSSELSSNHPVEFFQESSQYVNFIQDFLMSSKKSELREIPVTINSQQKYYVMAVQKYGQGESAVAVGIDITERYKAKEALRIAEENYRSIFENALEGIFQSSPEGKFIKVNSAFAKMYGYESPESLIESIDNISRQVYVDLNVRQEFQNYMNQADKVKNFEYQIYRKDGSIIWIEEDTRAVRDAEGNLLYYEGIIQDITHRKKEEEKLIRQLQELQIEIDQQKREQEVAQITQSDYFQKLKSEVDEIEVDQFWNS